MLHVILVVLKIILWIILILFGLLVLILILLLASPIRYKADVSYQGGKTMQALVNVRFLIVSVCLRLNQQTGENNQTIRLLGIRLGKQKKTRKLKSKTDAELSDENSEKKTEEKLEKITQDKTENKIENKIEEKSENIIDEKTEEKSESITQDQSCNDNTENYDIDTFEEEDFEDADEADVRPFDLDSDIEEDIPDKEKKLFGRIKVFFSGLFRRVKNIWNFIKEHTPDKIAERIEQKIGPVKKKLRMFQKFWNLSCTVKTRDYLKRYIPSVFRHIFPRRIKGYVHYGFDEPYKTGQITGYLSLLPFVYQKQLSLQPDFYEKVLKLHLIIKGKIRIGYLIRFILNMNLWRTLKAAKRIMDK